MPATWGNYQSAIQLVAGVNLALLAFPKLRQLETDTEGERWDRLLHSVPIGHPFNETVREAAVEFSWVLVRDEERDRRARYACLGATVVSVAALLWATYYAECPVNPSAAWSAIAVGFCPAGYFAAKEQRSSRDIRKASARRQALERERPR